MGIGIIALGLWLLLGISFSINSIELFPDALSMMIIMVGIVIVFRRVKSRELLISLGLWIISFIMEIFQLHFFYQWIWFLALAFVYIGIDHIAVEYPALKKYRYGYRLYLVVYTMILLLGELILKTNEASFMLIAAFFMIVLEILLIMVLYHMIKINHFLEEDYIQIHVQSLSYSFHQKAIIIVLSVISLLGIVYMKDGFSKQIQQEVLYEESCYLKVNEEDYKILPFGYRKEQQSTLFLEEELITYTPIEIYIRQDLFKDLSQVEYQILSHNKAIVSSSGPFQTVEYEEGETTPFPGYVGVYVQDDRYSEIQNIQDYTKSLDFVLKLYNQNGECYYQQMSTLEQVSSYVYRYEDENICMENLKYDMNVITDPPQIILKQNQDQITNILFYTVNKKNEENLILIYDNFLDQDHYKLNISQRFIHQPLNHLSKLKIEYRDENYQVIDSYICELEEVL